MTHSHSMIDQPKSAWVCDCGKRAGFDILLCPECKGDESHIIGFQCLACEVIHVTLTANPSVYAVEEDVFH